MLSDSLKAVSIHDFEYHTQTLTLRFSVAEKLYSVRLPVEFIGHYDGNLRITEA